MGPACLDTSCPGVLVCGDVRNLSGLTARAINGLADKECVRVTPIKWKQKRNSRSRIHSGTVYATH